MAMPDYESVDAYIAAQSMEARPRLTRIRNVIKRTVKRAEESISYKIPTYKLHGKPLAFFAAWKEHLSLYPATAHVFAQIPELLPFKHAKDTVRFRYDATLPVHLIARFATAREMELDASSPTPKASRTAKAPAPVPPAAKTKQRTMAVATSAGSEPTRTGKRKPERATKKKTARPKR